MAQFLIGFTQSTRGESAYHGTNLENYSSFDGYKLGAPQIELTVSVPDSFLSQEDRCLSMEEIAEAFFVATNDPSPQPAESLSNHIRESLEGYAGYKRSLSVGDTISRVAVGSEGVIGEWLKSTAVWDTVACESRGWTPVDISTDRNPVLI